jgi:hypothetical protein
MLVMLRAKQTHPQRRRRKSILILAILALTSAARTAAAAEKEVLQYNRDIRPILAENCFPCHGPDSAARKANLRLDRREVAIAYGAITPGDID